MLKLNIKATNIKLDDFLYEYIYEKIGTLDKFIEDVDSSVQVWVEVGKPSKHHQKGTEQFYAEVDIRLPGQGKVLRSESRQKDLRLAIDEVKDELQREEFIVKPTEIEIEIVSSVEKLKKALT